MARRVAGAVRQVIGFLVQGIELEAGGWRAFESEVRELVAPHMAVLAHRRAKLLDSAGRERWADELEGFIRQNLWPLLGDARDYAQRNGAFVTLMLDVAVAEAQRKAAVPRAQGVPLTARFDNAWAG